MILYESTSKTCLMLATIDLGAYVRECTFGVMDVIAFSFFILAGLVCLGILFNRVSK